MRSWPRCRIRPGCPFPVVEIVFALFLLWLCTPCMASMETSFAITGLTRPHREALLSAASPGRVAQILVREGASVKQGDMLIQLERRQEELERDRRKLILESEVEVQAAAATLTIARREFDSTRAVYESTRSISREELERKELAYKLADAEYAQAQLNKNREKIEYHMALEALRLRDIVAPMDGIVTQILIEEGEGCELREPLIRVVDASRVVFVANVEAHVLRSFAEGEDVALELPREDGTVYTVAGTISYVAPVVDAASGLGVLMAEFDNAEGTMLPGVAAVLRKPVADVD